jgi:sugar/nucleoside kinase (ribokinase family)/phosphoglycolate phosphatase-like HAD superfamily hydrolase
VNAETPRLRAEEIRGILEALPSLRFGVVGDFCLDVYLTVDPSASEISVETGLATQAVSGQRYSLGGAGNVTANLKALGAGTVRSFGVTGADPYGEAMRRIMGELGIRTDDLLVQPARWDTHTYTKIHVEGREQPRLDFGNFNDLSPETSADLLGRLARALPALDMILVNQQVLRGIHTPPFRRELAALLSSPDAPQAILDSRSYSDEFGKLFRKVNDREGALLCGLDHDPGESIPREEAREILRRLFTRWGRPLFLTRGSSGCLVAGADGQVQEVPGVLILGRTDPVGAGDSMLAGIAAALAAGASPHHAALFGNLAAAVTVQKLFQTGTASPEEILAVGADHGYRYHPELAAAPQRARYLNDTEIELVDAGPSSPSRIAEAIFDHDGTVSTLREGWQEVMEPVMLRSILGGRSEQVAGETRRRVAAQVREYIERTTGVQTLVQMRGLVEIVREFGLVPEEQILDEQGYKRVYNEALMRRIEERSAKVRRGELGVEDFTLKNAVGFLRRLYGAGVRLYLASGTDQADVEREAQLLGYAELFEGRIYGAIGDLHHEPKRAVLDRILQDREADGGFAVFGDGPVEIQEARKRGGLAVGVASDELRRFGLNPSKRGRLIEAGAHLVIPDFSQADALLEWLGIR